MNYVDLKNQTKKKWVINNQDEEAVKDFSKRFHVSEIISTYCLNRGVEDFYKYVRKDKENFHDPFLFSDMKKSVDRINQAIENHEKIVVYGDYDVDGITATSYLYLYLKDWGADVGYFIPTREEGYGISQKAIERCFQTPYTLMITVDCGITSVEEVELIKQRGCDVIITDHHTCKEDIPDAYAIISTSVGAENYPFKKLCGAGVALKLVHALGLSRNDATSFLNRIELVALGTVADVVSLTDENRLIVQIGIRDFKRTRNIGLRAMMDLLESGGKQLEINSTALGFVIGPRINAAGRMKDAKSAVELFTSQSYEVAKKIAVSLNQLNKERQDKEAIIQEEAIREIESNAHYRTDKVLIVAKKGWHAGIIGIVASRISEKYYKPTILISLDDNKGSCRSIKGIDIFEALSACKEDLIQFGGHAPAAGLSIETERIPDLRAHLNAFIAEKYTDDIYTETISIDKELSHEEITLENASLLEKCGPYGAGNSQGVWLARDLKVEHAELVGALKNHLMLDVITSKGEKIRVMGFGFGHLINEVQNTEKIDVVFKFSVNRWNNRESLQLMLVDISCGPLESLSNAFVESIPKIFGMFEHQDLAGTKRLSAQNILIERKRATILINSRQDLKTVLAIIEDLEKKGSTILGAIYCESEQLYSIATQNAEKYDIILDIVINPCLERWKEEIVEPCLIAGKWLNSGYKQSIINYLGNESIEWFDCSLSSDRTEEYLLDRKVLRYYYQGIVALATKGFLEISESDLIAHIHRMYRIACSPEKLILAVEIFYEAGLLTYQYEKGILIIELNEKSKSKEDVLLNSAAYNKLQEL